jgi:SNF2 family DNA or RNA helicase
MEIGGVVSGCSNESSRLGLLLDRTDKIVQKLDSMMKLSMSNTQKIDACDDESQNTVHVGQPKLLSGGSLRDYQLGGMEWLLSLHSSGLNGILADEMGLGKTIQVIAFFCALKERFNTWGPHLVVMPLSVISSWKSDFNQFVPYGVDLYIHHGDKESRVPSFRNWLKSTNNEIISNAKSMKIKIVLTTYDMIIKDVDLLKKIEKINKRWVYLVIDEAHRIKNRASVLYSSLKELNSRRRLLLTGTPLQNNLEELWSLLAFILPSIFDDLKQFCGWFNSPFEFNDGTAQDKGNKICDIYDKKLNEEEKKIIVNSLHRVIKPFLLRRLKTDGADDIPPTLERIVQCPQSDLQIAVYDMIKKRISEHEKIKGTENTNDDIYPAEYDFLNVLMQLRKLCNHPYLVLEDILSIPDDLYYKYLISSSGKMCVLDRLLKLLIPQNHKILIFSQMTTMMDILQGYIHNLGLEFFRLDGSIKAEDREMAIRSFNCSTSTCKIFLISTRAGGVGINLQAADTIILYDSDWNPQQDLQAMSRVHRLGQTKSVLVLRLVTVSNEIDQSIQKRINFTIEEKILMRARHKLDAERAILADGKFEMGTIRKNSLVVNSQQFSSIDTLDFIDDSKDAEVITNSRSVKNSKLSAMILFQDKGIGHEKDFNQINGGNIDSLCPSGASDLLSFSTLRKMCIRDDSAFNYCEDESVFSSCCNPITMSCRENEDWKLWLTQENRSIAKYQQYNYSTTSLDLENIGYGTRSRLNNSILVSLDDSSDVDGNNSDDNYDRDTKRSRCGKKKISSEKTKIRKKQKHNVNRESEIITDKKNMHKVSCAVMSAIDNECVLCGEPWIIDDNLPRSDSGSDHIRANYDDQLFMKLCKNGNENLMVICDSCDGPYHLLCIGLDKIPKEDWFCRFCEIND